MVLLRATACLQAKQGAAIAVECHGRIGTAQPGDHHASPARGTRTQGRAGAVGEPAKDKRKKG